MMNAVVCASLLMTLLTAGGAIADEWNHRATTELFEFSEAPDLSHVRLLLFDGDGHPYGTRGPWTFDFDLRGESAQPLWIVAGMASEVAAYMNTHPLAQLRIAGAGAPAKGRGVRDRRVSAIVTSLIAAGVPADSIRFRSN